MNKADARFSIIRMSFVLALAIHWASAQHAQGALSITAQNQAFTENFDTLANSGTTGSTVPNGWAFSESGTAADTTYGVGFGSSITGNTYSFGSVSATDRAFGGLQSGSLVPTIGGPDDWCANPEQFRQCDHWVYHFVYR
jgi:hypothetical protein